MKSPAIVLLVTLATSACAQNADRAVGGRCENCDLIFQDMPKTLGTDFRIAKESEAGTPLTISGRIFKHDGKTPAEGVIIYVYHTDAEGLYSPAKGSAAGNPHGHLRGWARTGRDGRYSFTTIRPASYPNSRAPQHIHAIIKEEGIAPYWIDEYVFKDDPFVDAAYEPAQQNRGGSGLITLTKTDDRTWKGSRDIVLGLNVPGY